MRQISVKIASTFCHFQDTVSTDANSEPCETYKMELLLKIVNGFRLLIIFPKSSIWMFDSLLNTLVYDALLESKFL